MRIPYENEKEIFRKSIFSQLLTDYGVASKGRILKVPLSGEELSWPERGL